MAGLTVRQATGYLAAREDQDEGVFVLLARDNFALLTVAKWLELAERSGEVSVEKLARAEDHLLELLEWRRQNRAKTKYPD